MSSSSSSSSRLSSRAGLQINCKLRASSGSGFERFLAIKRSRRRGGGRHLELMRNEFELTGSCKTAMAVLRLLLTMLLLGPQPEVSQALVPVPNRHTLASVPGELVLGILVPVHERPSPDQAQTRTCGAVREQYGIQRVEAAFRTIDSINADPNILPNVKLGIEIRDTCWHSPIALEQSIEFIRDAMAASEQTPSPSSSSSSPSPSPSSSPSPLLAGRLQSHSTGPMSAQVAEAGPPSSNLSGLCAPLLRQQQKKVTHLVGVVGPASSTDTVQVSIGSGSSARTRASAGQLTHSKSDPQNRSRTCCNSSTCPRSATRPPRAT